MKTSRKKIVVIFSVFLIIIIIVLSCLLILHFSKQNNSYQKKSIEFAQNLNSNRDIYGDNLPFDEIDKKLIVIKNQNVREGERYQALSTIFEYFNNAYFNTNAPVFREDSQIIENFALENFSSVHKKGKFTMACADEECGEKTPEEISEIINEINAFPLEQVWKNSIILNLKTASHIPYDAPHEKTDKIYTYKLVIYQLNQLSNTQASASASKLRTFIKNKYNREI